MSKAPGNTLYDYHAPFPVVTEVTHYNVREDLLSNRARSQREGWQAQFDQLDLLNPNIVPSAVKTYLEFEPELIDEDELEVINAIPDAIKYVVAHTTDLLLTEVRSTILNADPVDRASLVPYPISYPLPQVSGAVAETFAAEIKSLGNLSRTQTEIMEQTNPQLLEAMHQLHQDQESASPYANMRMLGIMEYALAYTHGVLRAQAQVDWLDRKFEAN